MGQKSKGNYTLFHQRAILNNTNKRKVNEPSGNDHNEQHLFKQFMIIKKNKQILINEPCRNFITKPYDTLITHNQTINKHPVMNSHDIFNFQPKKLKLKNNQYLELARSNLEFPFFLNGVFLDSPQNTPSLFMSNHLIQLMIFMALLVHLPQKLIKQLQSFINDNDIAVPNL